LGLSKTRPVLSQAAPAGLFRKAAGARSALKWNPILREWTESGFRGTFYPNLPLYPVHHLAAGSILLGAGIPRKDGARRLCRRIS
jgi:hypothetical protein